MRRLDDAFLEEVRARNDIVDVVGQYVRLTQKGGRWWGLCPFHTERTPSFSVSPDRQAFYCFGCQTGGTVFQFLMKRESVSFFEAVSMLAKRAHMAMPAAELTPSQAAAEREREAIYGALALAADYFHAALLRSQLGARAREYLNQRGVRDKSIEAFRLGYAPASWDALTRALGKRGVEPGLLVKAGLAQPRPSGDGSVYDRFRDRVMFPIRDIRGRVIGFGGRIIDQGEPKYLNSPEGPTFKKGDHLFALDLARRPMRDHGRSLIVEGYMDAVQLHQAGFSFAVASLGTALSQRQAQLLRQQVSEVIVGFDADAAGQKATLRGLEALTEAGCRVRVLRLPEGLDPDEFIRRHGAEAFQRQLDHALPLVDFRIAQAVDELGLGTVTSRSEFLRRILPVLASERDVVEQDGYLRHFAAVADRLGLGEAEIRAELAKYRARYGRKAPGATAPHSAPKAWHTSRRGGPEGSRVDSATTVDSVTPAEEALVQLLLLHPELVQLAQARLAPDSLRHPVLREVYEALAESAAGSPLSALERVSEGAAQAAHALLARASPIGNPAAEFERLIDLIGMHNMIRAHAELLREMERRSAGGQAPDPELERKILELSREIKKGTTGRGVWARAMTAAERGRKGG